MTVRSGPPRSRSRRPEGEAPPTREHVHQEVLPASPEEVFSILHTPSAIRRWWSAARATVLPEPGGLWAATWGDSEDDPDYLTVATIRDFEPGL